MDFSLIFKIHPWTVFQPDLGLRACGCPVGSVSGRWARAGQWGCLPACRTPEGVRTTPPSSGQLVLP